MICIEMQWTQVTAGVGFALLAEPGRFLPHVADSECTLEIANTYTVRTRRANGRILMEDALTRDYTISEIQAINRCRLYLQVEYLSDICTADGLRTDSGLRAQPPTVTFTEHDPVALPRAPWKTLVGNMEPVP
jgi:hypothetical protein